MANLTQICINGNCSDVADSLENLEDVEITSVADGDILKYDADSGKWINVERS